MKTSVFGPRRVKVATSSGLVLLVVTSVVVHVTETVTFDLMEVLLPVNFEHVLRKSVQHKSLLSFIH